MLTDPKELRNIYEKGIEYTFPSGLVALIRPVSVDWFIKVGYIPDLLTPFVHELMNSGSASMPESTSKEDDKQYVEFLNSLAESTFVYPKVLNNIDDDYEFKDNEIGVQHLEFSDKLELFQTFAKPAKELRNSFRNKQKNIVENLPVTGRNSSKSKQNNENKEMGKSD